MQILTESKTCPVCGNLPEGRSGKRFCSGKCRSTYNNQLRAKAGYPNYIRNVTNALMINRKILASLFRGEATKATFDMLRQSGFNFKYHTHTHHTKSGKTYFYSFDYGYLALEDDNYLIVKEQQLKRI